MSEPQRASVIANMDGAENDCSDNMSVLNASALRDNVRCEALCFIQQKCGMISFDHLSKLYADFFKTEEIISVQNLIGQYVKKRIPIRQESNIRRTTVEDFMRICLDP